MESFDTENTPFTKGKVYRPYGEYQGVWQQHHWFKTNQTDGDGLPLVNQLSIYEEEHIHNLIRDNE